MSKTLQGFLRIERAQELLEAGRPREALRLLERPLPAGLAAQRDFLRAESLRAQGYLGRAARLYRGLLGRAPERDTALWLDSCLALAGALRSLGQAGVARRILRAGRGVLRRQGLGGSREAFELEEALVERAAGLYPQSLKKLGRLLEAFRGRRDRSGTGFVLWACGGARRFSGDLAGSERDFRASLASFRRARDPGGVAYALMGLGGVLRIRGKLRQARDRYAEAARLLKTSPDLFARAYALCGLGNVLRQMGDFIGARRRYLLSSVLYARLEDWVDLAYVDWGLGQVALHQGNLEGSGKFFREALSAFKSGGETRGQVLAELSLAGLLHARGRARQAEELFRKACLRARKAGLHTHLEVLT